MHLLFLLTPVYHSVRPDYKRFNKTLHEAEPEIARVASLVGVVLPSPKSVL
jgi:hypothetical protein